MKLRGVGPVVGPTDRMKRQLMDFGELYNFLFNTFEGVGCLIGIGLVLSLIACVIMERRTRKRFANREASEDDWSFFDDDEDNSK